MSSVGERSEAEGGRWWTSGWSGLSWWFMDLKWDDLLKLWWFTWGFMMIRWSYDYWLKLWWLFDVWYYLMLGASWWMGIVIIIASRMIQESQLEWPDSELVIWQCWCHSLDPAVEQLKVRTDGVRAPTRYYNQYSPAHWWSIGVINGSWWSMLMKTAWCMVVIRCY